MTNTSTAVRAGAAVARVRARHATALPALSLILACGPGGARPAGAAPLLLREVLGAALEHNPAILTAQARARAAAAAPARARAYDDPTLSWEAYNFPESFAIDRADNNIVRLSQRIPFPGKRTRAGEAAARDADAAEHEARAAALEVLAEVKRAYYRLWQRERNTAIYLRDRDLVQQLATSTADRYAAGTSAQADVLRAQVELSRVRNLVTTERLAAAGAAADLNALLSRLPHEPLGTPQDPPPPPHLDQDASRLTALAFARRPDLAVQAAAIARDESRLRLARLGYLPDFEVTVGRFFNYDRTDGFGAMVSVSLPLAYKAKYDAGVAEATANLAAARGELRRLEDRVRLEVHHALLEGRTALEQRDLHARVHVSQAEQAWFATASAYQTGQADLLSLLDSVRALESFRLQEVEASADFERAYADLERAVGGELPRPGSDLSEPGSDPSGPGGAATSAAAAPAAATGQTTTAPRLEPRSRGDER